MKRTKGFTLTDLVVVAVIALLVIVLVMFLPRLHRNRGPSRQALCAANLNGIGKGFVLYQSENDDYSPWIDTPTGHPPPALTP
ncbi:MAG: hypothetical protein SVV80_14300 [Planctomycetota bacterium]|nr:hypothetical protein [Planctomycetota bacterium]